MGVVSRGMGVVIIDLYKLGVAKLVITCGAIVLKTTWHLIS